MPDGAFQEPGIGHPLVGWFPALQPSLSQRVAIIGYCQYGFGLVLYHRLNLLQVSADELRSGGGRNVLSSTTQPARRHIACSADAASALLRLRRRLQCRVAEDPRENMWKEEAQEN